jgi:hypothetical protein
MQYPTEHNHAAENTARSKSWKYVLAIQKLTNHKVKWIVPDPNNPPEQRFLVSIDGTHCQISEPRNAYALAILVYNDKLVWINGPFCASVGDNTI